ncbi:MAG: HD domain-containing protein [Anaeroplasmataceae bacterium]|nr:HD domain-containing protein [Anaeroplasmataceae bacterium]
MSKNYLKYAENLKRYVELDNIKFTSLDTKEYVLSSLHRIAIEKRNIFVENNQIIEEYILPLEKKAELTTEDVALLEEFSASLSLRFGSLDNSIYFRIHKLLLAYALQASDINAIVKEKYYCGFCEYLIEASRTGKRKLSYFKSIEAYQDQYDSLSIEGKNYFLRCYGNQLLDNEFIYERSKRILEFVQEQQKNHPHPDIPYDRYILSIERNVSGALAYFRSFGKDMESVPKEYVELVYEAAVYSLEHLSQMKQTSLVSAVLYKYTFYAASFHYGKITIEELLEKLDELSNPNADYDLIERASSIIKMTAYYIEYYRSYTDITPEELLPHLLPRTKKVLDFVSQIPISEFTDTLNEELISFLKVASSIYPFEQIKSLLFQVLIVRNPSTFIHVDMVRRISSVLTKELLKKNPSFFNGILENFSLPEILSQRDRILKTIEDMAMFHDVGKHFFIKYISLSHRKIEDAEYEIIKLHSSVGYQTLAKGRYPDPISEGILLHHLWHDGTGGYPKGEPQTNNQPLIDILSVADTIDAATDYVGRPYSLTKTLSSLLEELRQYKGTRYSGEVIELFEEKEVFTQVEKIITEVREEVAYKIWTNEIK